MPVLPGDLRSSLVAGGSAFLIYLVIGLAIREPATATVLIAVVLGVVTTAATLLVNRVVTRRRRL